MDNIEDDREYLPCCDSQGLYLGEAKRQWDAISKKFMIPSGSVLKDIPSADPGIGKVWVWDGCEWKSKTDNSGIYYRTDNKQEVIINHPLADTTGLTKIKPPDDIKFSVWENDNWTEDKAVKKEYDNKIIEQKLLEIDQKRIRPLSKIVNPDIKEKDKKIALDEIRALELQENELRSQIL